MIFAGIGVIINIVLNLILVQYMEHNGLALATSIAALCHAALLWLGICYKYAHIKLLESKGNLIKIIIAAAVPVGGSYILYSCVIIPSSHIIIMRTAQLGIVVVSAGIIYLTLLKLFGIRELELLRLALRKKR